MSTSLNLKHHTGVECFSTQVSCSKLQFILSKYRVVVIVVSHVSHYNFGMRRLIKTVLIRFSDFSDFSRAKDVQMFSRVKSSDNVTFSLKGIHKSWPCNTIKSFCQKLMVNLTEFLKVGEFQIALVIEVVTGH